MVDPREADAAREQNLSSTHVEVQRQRKEDARAEQHQRQVKRIPAGSDVPARQLLDRIRERVFRYLPELVLAIADELASVPLAQRRLVGAMLAPAIFDQFLLTGEDDVPTYRWPACPEPDYNALAKIHDIPGTVESWEAVADLIADVAGGWLSSRGLW
jgi:hypothetical protein